MAKELVGKLHKLPRFLELKQENRGNDGVGKGPGLLLDQLEPFGGVLLAGEGHLGGIVLIVEGCEVGTVVGNPVDQGLTERLLVEACTGLGGLDGDEWLVG